MKKLLGVLTSSVLLTLMMSPSASANATILNEKSQSATADARPVTQKPAKTLAGYFTWSVFIKCCQYSRKWYQAGGSTIISSKGTCSGGSDFTKYYITLYRDEIVDDTIKSVTFACDKSLEYTFTGLKSGTYYFKISKQDDARTQLSANGSVSYP